MPHSHHLISHMWPSALCIRPFLFSQSPAPSILSSSFFFLLSCFHTRRRRRQRKRLWLGFPPEPSSPPTPASVLGRGGETETHGRTDGRKLSSSGFGLSYSSSVSQPTIFVFNWFDFLSVEFAPKSLFQFQLVQSRGSLLLSLSVSGYFPSLWMKFHHKPILSDCSVASVFRAGFTRSSCGLLQFRSATAGLRSCCRRPPIRGLLAAAPRLLLMLLFVRSVRARPRCLTRH